MSTLVEMYKNKKIITSYESDDDFTEKVKNWLNYIALSLTSDSRWESTINNIVENIKDQYNDANYYTILKYSLDDHLSNNKIVPFTTELNFMDFFVFQKEQEYLDEMADHYVVINSPGNILHECNLVVNIDTINNTVDVRLCYNRPSNCTLI